MTSEPIDTTRPNDALQLTRLRHVVGDSDGLGVAGSLGLGSAAMRLAAIFGAFVLLTGCGCASRKITTVSLPYATVTNKVNLLRPAPGASGIVFSRESERGAKFARWMREPGGDVKFGPYTTVYVTRVDAHTTRVELTTGRHSLLLFGHYRHLFFRERARWRELQEILRNDA